MAFPMIETGYKPDGALGALYQGFNAANANQGAELELVKQFLANQREQQSQPLDLMVKDLQAQQAQVQNTPEMLQKFKQNAEAGYDKTIRENELGTLLQPFKKQQVPLEGQRDVNFAQIDNEISSLQNTLRMGVGDNGVPLGEPLKQDLNARLQELIARRGTTPEHWGKVDVENIKGQWDIDKQRLANQGAANAASISGGKAERTAAITAAGQVASALRNIDTNLAKLDTAEMEAAITQQIMSAGRPVSPDAIAQAKSVLKRQLETEKQEYRNQLQYLYKSAGLDMGQVTPQQTSPTIKPMIDPAAALAELERRKSQK